MINKINVRKSPQVGQPFRIFLEYLYVGFDTFGSPGGWMGVPCGRFVRGMNNTDGTILIFSMVIQFLLDKPITLF